MATLLYELFFKYQNNDGDHYFQIGYFSSEQKAQEVICTLQNKPGFIDHKNGFFCDQIEVDDAAGTDLYELSYEEYNDTDGYDYSEVFGVYSSLSSALKKQQELLDSIDKNYSSEGFTIAFVKVDSVGWGEGFDSWQ